MIVAAALRHRETKLVLSMPQPARHHHLIHAQYAITGATVGGQYEQGFVSSNGNFYNRSEALTLARWCDQILTKHDSENELHSDDMW